MHTLANYSACDIHVIMADKIVYWIAHRTLFLNISKYSRTWINHWNIRNLRKRVCSLSVKLEGGRKNEDGLIHIGKWKSLKMNKSNFHQNKNCFGNEPKGLNKLLYATTLPFSSFYECKKKDVHCTFI